MFKTALRKTLAVPRAVLERIHDLAVPKLVKFLLAALACAMIGALMVGMLLGNMGVALLGTAIPVFGWLIGAIAGPLVLIFSWAGRIVLRDMKRT
ncbi:hypothetical protein SAMN05421774_105248 [Gemmobacter megaterium]|uniref:Holin-X, holin superfamily III n=1 Tax=Gemmobacter megaterium TaxID=1086013 RepID=A0A1N7PGX5_9RHOB|nr:hypothetical protein [Gemmobacter megaterium]GGE18299.1 hypothetical protein GCM10011345_25190 [Gemmobacter megaterium]SIT09851.1 hypothetical protein SAMN05421774_105248 [Gemmobacter megaterium]